MSIQVRVVYHFEDGAWWADSEDSPGYYAGGGGSFEQFRERVREGLVFHLNEPVEISEEIVEVVTRTHPGFDIEVEQTVRYHITHMTIFGVAQVTTSTSRPISVSPSPALARLDQPTAVQNGAMAGY